MVTLHRGTPDTLGAVHAPMSAQAVAIEPTLLRDIRIEDETGSTVRPFGFFGGVLYGFLGANLHSSSDDGLNWTLIGEVNAGSGDMQQILLADDGEVLVSRSGALVKSSGWPSNPTWTVKVTPNGSAFFSTWSFSGDGTKFIISEYAEPTRADSQNAWISTDAGDTWAAKYDVDQVHGNTDSHLHGAAYDPWDDRFWVCDAHGDGNGIYFSDDDGDNWTQLTGDFEPDPAPTVVVATDKGMVFGSDAAETGIYVVRRAAADRLKLEFIYSITPAGTSALGDTPEIFARSGWRDPRTGLVYIGWESETGTTPGIILASDGVSAGLVYQRAPMGDGGSGERIRFIVVTGTGTLIARNLNTGDGNKQVFGKVGVPGVQTRRDVGRILGGQSKSNRAVAVGSRAVAFGRAVAVGQRARADGDNRTALGDLANASGEGGTAIGQGASAPASSVAVGQGATGSGGVSVAVGRGAVSAGNGVAIGHEAEANHINSVAIGRQTTTSKIDEVALGNRDLRVGRDIYRWGVGSQRGRMHQVRSASVAPDGFLDLVVDGHLGNAHINGILIVNNQNNSDARQGTARTYSIHAQGTSLRDLTQLATSDGSLGARAFSVTIADAGGLRRIRITNDSVTTNTITATFYGQRAEG